MGNINVNFGEIDNALRSLAELKGTCLVNSILMEGYFGGGLTISELETLEKSYSELFSVFSEVIERTMSMLIASKSAMADADRRAAQAFESGE